MPLISPELIITVFAPSSIAVLKVGKKYWRNSLSGIQAGVLSFPLKEKLYPKKCFIQAATLFFDEISLP